MFGAGLTGYNVTRGLLGALKSRGPRAGLVEDLLAAADADACRDRLRNLPFLDEVEVTGNAADLERALRFACWRFASKVMKFLGGSAGQFLRTYCFHYDLHNAKILFRASLDGELSGMRREVYRLSSRYAPGSVDGLQSPEEVVRFYRDTPLAEMMADAFELYRSHEGDLSLFEIALDREYVSAVWKSGQDVRQGEGRRLTEMILRPWLATTAVFWTLWMSTYRGMSAEEVVTILNLPDGIIAPGLCTALVKGDADTVERQVHNKHLKRFLAGGALNADLADLSRIQKRFLWEVTGPAFFRTTFDISTLVSALVRWEIVIDDAITVASSKEMGLQGDEIVPLLATQAA